MLVVAAACTAVIFGCSEPERTDEPDQNDEQDQNDAFEPWNRPVEGEWVRGDVHVHATGASNDASEESTPERIKEVGVERNLDFVVLTDHSNSTGSDPSTQEEDPELFNQGPEFPYWEQALELSDESFLMVQGNELSPVSNREFEPTGHIGCIPRSIEDFDPDVAFVDRPRGEVSGGEALEQAQDVGCFAIVNHPFGPVAWISYDWTSYDYDGVEIWNGGAGFNEYDESAIKGWACDLSRERRPTPIGASDNHKVEVEPPGEPLDPPLGTPVTWVWAEQLAWADVVAGLNSGAVAVSDTAQPLEIDVFENDGRWLALAGGEFEPEGERTIRLRGARDRSEEPRQLRLLRVAQGACEDLREEGKRTRPEPNWEVVEQWEIDESGEFERQAVVDAAGGDVFFGWLRPEDISFEERDVAISGAVFAR